MVAYLPKLHDKVHQILHFGLALNKLEEVLSRDLILDSLIQDSLPMSHCASVSEFGLGSYLQLNIVFKSAKHEWLQDKMKPSELVLVNLSLIRQGVLFYIF